MCPLNVTLNVTLGWSIDSNQETSLVTNALGMAIDNRNPFDQTVIHSDQGTQFTSWAFTRRALDSGLLASMGSVGDCYDCEDPLAVVRPLEGSQPLSLRVA